MEYYSTREKKEVLKHATMWIKHENTMLNKKQPVTKDRALLYSIYMKWTK